MNQKLINFSELSIEALAEAAQGAFEECESVFHAIEKNYSTLERFGRILSAAKEKVPHGEWENWITDTFQGRLPLRTARRWMLEAKRPDLADLRRETDRQKSRARVEVIDPKETKPPDPGEIPPLPKTNTEYTAENRQANSAELPPTRPVSVQAELIRILDDPPDPLQLLEACFRHNPVTAIIRYIINSTAPQDTEDVAKQLRKGADMLDPPKKADKAGSTPSVSQLVRLIPETFPDDLRETVSQWAAYKQGRTKGERIQSEDAWRIALKQIWKACTDDGIDVVIRKIEKAIANSWKGWDHGDDSKGKPSGKTGRIKPSATVPNIEYR